MGTTRVDLRIPEELVERADLAAKLTHKSRTDIVAEALSAYLDDIGNEDAFCEYVVELYLDGDIESEKLGAFIGRQDAQSILASKALLDDAETLADDLAALCETTDN